MSQKINEIFSWITIDIDGVEFKVKYTLGSFIDIKDAGIDINDPNSLSSPENLASIIYFGLPKEAQSKITPRELAYQIPVDQLENIASQVSGAVQTSLLDRDPGEDNDISDSKKN